MQPDSLEKKSTCPKCGSEKVLKIIYGSIEDPSVLKDDEIPGGCIEKDVQWHCGDCHWEWGDSNSGSYNPPDIYGKNQ